MEENIQTPQPPLTPTSPTPLSSHAKTIIFVAILIGIFLLLFITPIPYYQSEEVSCKPGQTNCPRIGWHWNKSLYQSFMNYIQYSSRSQISQVDTPTPTPSPTETPAEGDTANWKTYTNSTIGVEFKYPPDWKITTSPNNSKMVLIVSSTVPTDKFGVPSDENSPGYIRVIYYVCEELSTKKNVPCDTFDQLTANTRYDLQSKTIKETTVTVSGKQGAQISGVSKYGGFRKFTFFPAGQFQQSLITYHTDTETIYDQILSTFKFTK